MSSRDEHDTKQRELLAKEPAREERASSAAPERASGPSAGKKGSDPVQSAMEPADNGPENARGRPAWLQEHGSAPKWMPQPPQSPRPRRDEPSVPPRSAGDNSGSIDGPPASGATKLPTIEARTPHGDPSASSAATRDQAPPAELFPGLKRFLEGIGTPPPAGSAPPGPPPPSPAPQNATPPAFEVVPGPQRPAPFATPEREEPRRFEDEEPRRRGGGPLPVPETMPTGRASLPVPETMPTGGSPLKKPQPEGKGSGLFSSAKELFSAPKEPRAPLFPAGPGHDDRSSDDRAGEAPSGRTQPFSSGRAAGPAARVPTHPEPTAPVPPAEPERLFPRPQRQEDRPWGDAPVLGNRSAPFAPGQPEAPAARHDPFGRPAPEQRPTAESLTADVVLRKRGNRPGKGWRRSLYRFTLGYVNLGPSQAELMERQQNQRIRTALVGSHRLAVISLKGGVGKTTTTAGLGATFASVRGDRVIAIDANPDRGTLGEKVPRQTPKTVRDLLANRADIHRYSDVRAYTSQANSRLEVLASDTDPAMSAAFSEEDYRQALGILSNFYSLILTDCGTGLLHDAMRGVLAMADSLVVISSASLDGARSASATLDWLEAHGYEELVSRSVAVISAVHGGGTPVDIDKLEEHFAARCRAVVRIPWDPHLEEGSVVELEELRGPTRDAYRELAALVADDFPTSRQFRPSNEWGTPPRR